MVEDYSGRGVLGQASEPLTANAVIERIRKNVGVAWRTQTVDNIVLGDGAAPVKGVAKTMMATFEVVKRCVTAGINPIVSHETPVYMRQDDVKPVANDPAFLAKQQFVEKNGAVVFHFHDHWHARNPDGIASGLRTRLLLSLINTSETCASMEPFRSTWANRFQNHIMPFFSKNLCAGKTCS